MKVLTPVWVIQSNGIDCTNEIIGKRKDVKAENLSFIQNAYPEQKITMVEVGVNCLERNILFSDLYLNTVKEMKSIKYPMLHALITESFDNDNMTYFMLERGLVNEDRKSLSPKGEEIKSAWLGRIQRTKKI